MSMFSDFRKHSFGAAAPCMSLSSAGNAFDIWRPMVLFTVVRIVSISDGPVMNIHFQNPGGEKALEIRTAVRSAVEKYMNIDEMVFDAAFFMCMLALAGCPGAREFFP